MKNSRAVVAMVAIALVIAIGAMAGRTANAATTTVPLGTAGAFSILAGTPSITNTGATTIDRNVGIHPAASITGFPPGVIGGTTHAGDAVALQAKSDLVIAYNNAAGRTGTVVAGGTLGGLTLVDGVYNSGLNTVLDLTGTLTLDGQNDASSVWIFQAQSSLVTASTSSVSLINGANACNVFWQVTSSATLGSSSTIVGTIMALSSITLANGVTVLGRALARNGNVTLINDTFITGGCTPQTVFIPPTAPPFTVAPSATPIVAPTATPIGTAAATVAPTAAAAVAPTASPARAGVRVLPSTSTNDSVNPLLMLGIALAGIGIFVLRRRPIRNS